MKTKRSHGIRHGLIAVLGVVALGGITTPVKAQTGALPIPAPAPRKETPPQPAAPPVAQDLGDRDRDLVFVPVTPCRIADSRNATDPNYRRFSVSSSKNYNFIERTDYSAYGGQAVACSPPLPFYNGFEPEALAVNFTVTGPEAAGFLRAFPFATAATPASNLNWAAGQTVANSAIVRICNFCGPDLTVKIDGAGAADVIIDLFGYYIAAPPVGDTYISTNSLVGITGAASIESPPCNTGYRVSGGGFFTSLSDVYVSKSAPSASGLAWGIDTYRALDTYNAIVYGVCLRFSGRPRV